MVTTTGSTGSADAAGGAGGDATGDAADARFPAERLAAFCDAVLTGAGMPPHDARIAASAIVEADLRGVTSHGMRILPMYARRLRAGGTNARPNVRIVSEGPGVALLDGDHGDGHVVGHRAMEIAIAKARACGIGACTVRNSEHFGIAAYYAMQALAHGMIGFATGNSSAIVPPPGGRVGRVGNNATAYALPTRDEPPVVLDVAMSIAARARIMQHVETDRPIPEGWALDGDGLPTTDARAASEGALLPIGGYKGFGLSLLWDALSGVLSGGRFGIHVSRAPDDEPHEVSHFMLALDPAAFGAPDDFRIRMDEVVRTIRETPRQPGIDRVRAPGERAAELRSAHLAEGIALPRLTVDQVNGIAEQLGIPDRLTPSDRGTAG